MQPSGLPRVAGCVQIICRRTHALGNWPVAELGGQMKRIARGPLIAVLLMSAACQPAPKVEFAVSDKPDYSGAYKFTLAKTAIKLDYGKSADGKAEDRRKITATAVPMEDESRVFTMSGRYEDLFSITTVSVTTAGDTRMFKTVGSDVQSKVEDLIKNVGGIVAVVAPLVFVSGGDLPKGELPDVIEVSSHLTTTQPGEVKFSGRLVNGISYELTVSPVAKDAIVTDEYLASREFKGRSAVLFYSACRSASLALANFPSAGRTTYYNFKVADPKFVQTIALPTKGAVTFHDTCGVDVAQQRSDAPTGDKILSTLVAQVKAIIDAKNKK